jgi:hypothetical protein
MILGANDRGFYGHIYCLPSGQAWHVGFPTFMAESKPKVVCEASKVVGTFRKIAESLLDSGMTIVIVCKRAYAIPSSHGLPVSC